MNAIENIKQVKLMNSPIQKKYEKLIMNEKNDENDGNDSLTSVLIVLRTIGWTGCFKLLTSMIKFSIVRGFIMSMRRVMM